MATTYKNNIPYSDNNAAVTRWATDNSVGTVSSASIDAVRVGQWDLTVNGSVVRSFAGAPSAMTGLYELFKAGGGDDASFSLFSLTVTPIIDMTGVDVTDTEITITGHTWEDYSGRPMVIFYDGDNRVISSISVTGTEVVSIPANTDRIVVGAAGAIPVFYTSIEIPIYVWTVDRRPMFVAAYASQKMEKVNGSGQEIAGNGNGVGPTWGVNQTAWRRAPLAGSPENLFTDPATNGPLNYVQGIFTNPDQPIDLGFERMNISFISGWTNLKNSVSDDDDVQGHYPSNPYSGLELSETQVMMKSDSTVNSFTSYTPFTPTGEQSGDAQNPNPKGDMKKCWTVAVADLKQDIINKGGDPQIICYAGYRPLYTDNTMASIDRTLLGYSTQSDRGGWTGTGDSPGYTPTPGQNTPVSAERPVGYSSSDEAFSAWWDYELDGVRELGFDGIGLDTASGMWWNAANMTGVGNAPNGDYGNVDGSPRLWDFFKDRGLFTQAEAVTWEALEYTTKPWSGSDAPTYEQGAYWGLAGTTVGWVGRTLDSLAIYGWSGLSSGPNDGTLPASVYNFDQLNVATLGDPVEGGLTIDRNTTEVHSIWRWGNVVFQSLLGTFTWPAMCQIMYDFHSAGFVVGSGGSTTNTMTDAAGQTITAKEFNEWVVRLSLADTDPLNPEALASRPDLAFFNSDSAFDSYRLGLGGQIQPPPVIDLPPDVLTRVSREQDDAAGDLVVTTGTVGYLRADSNYSFIYGGNNLPTNEAERPQLRVAGNDLWVDIRFSSPTYRDNFIKSFADDPNDANAYADGRAKLRLHLKVTDQAGDYVFEGITEPHITSGKTSNDGTVNLQMKIRMNNPQDWIGTGAQWTHVPATQGTEPNLAGYPEGLRKNCGVVIDFRDAPLPASEISFIEKLEDSATPLTLHDPNGWYQANNAYTLGGTYAPASQNGTYPRLRSTGLEPSTNCVVDYSMGTEAARDALLANVDQTKLFARVTVTEGGVSYTADSDVFNPATGLNSTQWQIRFDLPGTAWATRPQTKAPQVDFPWGYNIGSPPATGWNVNSGFRVELMELP